MGSPISSEALPSGRTWRLWRDAHYMDALRLYGPEALEAAGHFDDGACALSLERALDPWPLTTPMHKLRRSEDGRPPIVLLCTGAYSPPHSGHLEMLDGARDALRERGLHVAGGYLSPGHDGYVSGKRGGAAALPAPHRVRLCEAAVADSRWLMVCPWEALWVGLPVNLTDVARRLESYLRTHWDERCEVAYACGSDNAAFARAFAVRGRCVVVPRDGSEEVAQAILEGEGLRAARDEGRVLLAQAGEASGASSTRSRHTGEHLTARVADEMARWGFSWEQGGEGEDESDGPLDYALRDDLRWATAAWREAPGVDEAALDEALDAFRSGVVAALRRAFAEVQAPDRPRGLQMRLLDQEAQVQQARALPRQERLVSLDVCVCLEHELHLAREFGLSDGQVFSNRLRVRPGHPPLAQQIASLPVGTPLSLIDDDIASGFTTESAALILASHDIAVEGAHALLGPSPLSPFDVVDLRDFLLGAREAGLVVRLPDGSLSRAPYLPPWVSLVSRAKVPPSSAWRLGLDLWALNKAFFEAIPVCARDAHEGSRSLISLLGARPETRLSALCSEQARLMRDLPFWR
jgi:hypothetical protein